jgi:hypothetical protein
MTTEAPILDMTADELRAIARKLLTYAYADIRAADVEAEKMAKRCWEIAALLDANCLRLVDNRPARCLPSVDRLAPAHFDEPAPGAPEGKDRRPNAPGRRSFTRSPPES